MSAPFIIPNILEYLQQFTSYPLGIGPGGARRPLCREDYDWSSIQLKVNLGGAVASDPVSDDDTYNGPKNFHSLLFGIQAHIGSNDLSDETLSVPNLGNPTMDQRIEMIAQNTKIELENLDKQGGSKIIQSAPKRLRAFLGAGIWFPIPILVQNADTLKMTATWVDADLTAVASGDWDVGLDLWVLQVRADV